MTPLLGGVLRYGLLAAILALVALPVTAPAEPKKFTLQPRPMPEARSFAISEVGTMQRVGGRHATPGDGEASLVTDHGVLFNSTGHPFALGPVIHFEAGGDRSRLGPAVRVRRWLGTRSAVDVEAGALLFGSEDYGIDFRGPAPFVQVSMSAGDIIVIHAQAQPHAVHLRGNVSHVGGMPPTGVDEDVNDMVTHVGVRLGTRPGVLASAIMVVVMGVTLLMWARASS